MDKYQKGSSSLTPTVHAFVHPLLAVTITAIGIIGLVLYSWRGLQISKPNNVQDEILGWKTYTNGKYGFSIKYPPDWEIWSVDGSIDFPPNTATPLPETGTNLLLGYEKKDKDQSTSKQMQLYIDIFENEKQLTIPEYFKRLGWSDNYLDNMKETKLNDFNAVEMALPSTDTEYFFIMFDGYIAEFRFDYFETQNRFSTPPNQTFRRILSTFSLNNEGKNELPAPTNTEGAFCGGFAGIKCPKGYKCKLDGNYPDAGGKCIKTN